VSPDVVVVGAGAIGSSIAYYLAKAGARVALLDRGAVGAEATGASAGMLIPLSESAGPGPFVDLAVESVRLFDALNEELRERTGMDIGYRRASLLRVALDEMEEHDLRQRRAWQDRAGIPVAWLDATSAREVEPALNPEDPRRPLLRQRPPGQRARPGPGAGAGGGRARYRAPGGVAGRQPDDRP